MRKYRPAEVRWTDGACLPQLTYREPDMNYLKIKCLWRLEQNKQTAYFLKSAIKKSLSRKPCCRARMELYLDLFSQPCRSVYMFAKKNNIPFEFKQLSLLDGEQYGEEFGKISLIRKVPALRDGDFCLAESIAILLYLAEKFKTPDFWYPDDLQQRARINEYLSWQHMAIRMHGSKIFWLRLLIPKVLGVDVPQDKLDAALEDLNSSLKLIEEKFIQDRPFIAGEHVSLADLVAIVEVMQPVGSGLDVFEGRPRLSAWRDRVQEAIGKELFDDAHQAILGAQENVKQMSTSKIHLFKPKIQKLFM